MCYIFYIVLDDRNISKNEQKFEKIYYCDFERNRKISKLEIFLPTTGNSCGKIEVIFRVSSF